jgi:hypothetical protein
MGGDTARQVDLYGTPATLQTPQNHEKAGEHQRATEGPPAPEDVSKRPGPRGTPARSVSTAP